MDNVRTLKKPLDKETVKLYHFGTDIDQVLIHYLEQGMDPREMAVVVGHRVGELLRTVEDKADVIITVTEYMKQRAGV